MRWRRWARPTEEYKANKKDLQEQKEYLNNKLIESKNGLSIKSSDAIMKEQLRSYYEILSNPNVEVQRKYEISHLLIDRIEFSKTASTLDLQYKLYQME